MLHILLLILKIIGIIIAVILGILVLLVCVVLFVPVRYDLEAASDGTLARTRMETKVTWLLHLVRVDLRLEDKKFAWQVRVAWKKIQSGQEGKKTIGAEVETDDEKMEEDGEDFEEEADEERVGPEKEPGHPGNVPEETYGGTFDVPEEEGVWERSVERLDKEQEGSKEGLKEGPKVWEGPGGNVEGASKEPERLVDELEREMEKILDAGNHPKEEKTADAKREDSCEAGQEEWETDRREVRKERQVDREGGREERETDREGGREERETDREGSEEERAGIWQKITGICQGIYQKIVGLYHKITKILAKVGSTVEGIGNKILGLLEKKDKILEFLSDEVHQTAFGKARDEVIFLLRRLKPGTIRADIRYGFDDPSLTGKVLAGVSMCYPFLGDAVVIRPDFGKKIFDGHLEIAGRLRASYFLKLLWKLIWSKEVRMTYRHVRSFEW